MRASLISLVCLIGFTLTSCNIGDRSDRRDSAARQAGRDAYRASRDLKKDAKQAARELRDASKQFREGWSKAQEEDARRRNATRSEADRYDPNQPDQKPPKPHSR